MKELFAIQQALEAPKDQFNSFGDYKYRSCEGILKALKPLLKEQECIIVLGDETINIGQYNYIKATALLYKAGESEPGAKVAAYAREGIERKKMHPEQLTGSASSYARKYALCGLFGIDDGIDSDKTNKHEPDNSYAKTLEPDFVPEPEDTRGAGQESKESGSQGEYGGSKPDSIDVHRGTISEKQERAIKNMSGKWKLTERLHEIIKKDYGKDHIAELDGKQASQIIGVLTVMIDKVKASNQSQ